MKKERLCVLCLSLVAILGAPAEAEPSRYDPGGIAPGTSRKILLDERVAGFRRSFRLHVPAGWKQGEPRPLVLALHGGLATSRILEKQTGFSEVADRHGFLVVYPDGMGFGSLARHWNGGYCCAKALKIELDDLGFLDRVTEWIAQRYEVDEKRIFVVGYSNGGMLAYWYAAERAEKIAGLGIWASSIGSLEENGRRWSWPKPKRALPVFISHGSGDKRLPYESPKARAGEKQKLLGAVASAEAWVRANRCDEEPDLSKPRGGALEFRQWCAGEAAQVVFLGIDGWGHDWPTPKRIGKLEASHPLSGFYLAEEMWRFFAGLP